MAKDRGWDYLNSSGDEFDSEYYSSDDDSYSGDSSGGNLLGVVLNLGRLALRRL